MPPSSNWYNAIAHVDADCFFASCELIRRPDLKGKPVCVLSSQDACVVAKTYDAKARGINTGMPVWEARALMPEAHFLSADFYFYGQVSEKMFSILRRFSPEIEIYSIDEGFIDMNGIRSMWRMSYRELADHIRTTIYHEIGITVSVGISTTRILAKIASDQNKPNGSTVIPGRRIEAFLREIPIGDVPGIGRNRVQLLHKYQIKTAFDFCAIPVEQIDTLLGKAGVDLWHELHGKPVYPLVSGYVMPKSISRTASLGRVSKDLQLLRMHLSYHTTRVVTELIRQNLSVGQLLVFLKLQSFDVVSSKMNMSPVQDFSAINKNVQKMLIQLFRQGESYRACGVVVTQLYAASMQGDLFTSVRELEKQRSFVQVMDNINQRYGQQMIKPALALLKAKRSTKFKYPVLNRRVA